MNTHRKLLRIALVAVFLAALSGCATTTNTVERSSEAGQIGCGFVPFASGLCKAGFEKLETMRRDSMYQTLGRQALASNIYEPTRWSYEKDRGSMIVHSRVEGQAAGIGAYYVMQITYFYITDDGIEDVSNVTLVAIPNPNADTANDEPAYFFLWQ